MQVGDGTELLSVLQLSIHRISFLFHALVSLATAERKFVQNVLLQMLFVPQTRGQHTPRYNHCFLCILPLSNVM